MIQDFSANDQEFVSILGRLSRISRQNWPRICQYLGRWSRFCQQMAKVFLTFWAGFPAGLVDKPDDFLKLLEDDHKDLLACLRKLSRICH